MKYLSYILLSLFVISFFFTFTKFDYEINNDEEIRAIYFSYIELDDYIKDKDDNMQKENIKKILDNVNNSNFNRIILHVRPFSDSIYESSFYPISNSILNNLEEVPKYDILNYFITEAHSRNIKVDAWINPYRISNSKDINTLSSDNIYYKFKDSKVTEKGIYLNPANKDVQKLIVDGIVEIVKKYDIDGIHFDDYFYPDKEIDLDSYSEYTKNGGKKNIDEYRLDNVKQLIKNVYSKIKSINKKILFGIAPEGNIDNCYNNSYLDVKEILSNDDYVDYIMPQIYFGFNNETRPYIKTLNEWNNMIKNNKIKLIPALAIYKSGKIDKYALSGKNEWINNSNIIKNEIIDARKVSNYKGFSLFSYNYLFNNDYQNETNKKEFTNLKELLEK